LRNQNPKRKKKTPQHAKLLKRLTKKSKNYESLKKKCKDSKKPKTAKKTAAKKDSKSKALIEDDEQSFLEKKVKNNKKNKACELAEKHFKAAKTVNARKSAAKAKAKHCPKKSTKKKKFVFLELSGAKNTKKMQNRQESFKES
jgi:hypothetical protein